MVKNMARNVCIAIALSLCVGFCCSELAYADAVLAEEVFQQSNDCEVPGDTKLVAPENGGIPKNDELEGAESPNGTADKEQDCSENFEDALEGKPIVILASSQPGESLPQAESVGLGIAVTATSSMKTSMTKSPAESVLEDGVYTISSAVKDSVRMEIGGASDSNGARANVCEDNWTAAQRWFITSLGNGYYKIMNVASGKYLDVASAKVGNEARVQQYEWNGTKAQQWAIVQTGSGYKLHSALSSAYLLDLSGANTANGTAIQLYESNDTKAQRWILSRIEPVLSDGLYTVTVKSSGKVLDVSGGSVYDAANVQQYQSNGTMAQGFYLSYNSANGYYTILGSASGLALDVSGAANFDGANVQMYTPNGTKAQRWAIEKNSDGTYTLHSAISGRALDVSGASQADGANVQTWETNGTNAQRWTFVDAGSWSIPEGVYNIVTGVNQANSLMVANSSRDESANVQTALTSSTSWGQKWIFTIASDGYYSIRNLNSRLLLEVADSSAQSGSNVQQQSGGATDEQLWKPELTAGGIVFRSKANNSVVLDIIGASTSVGANAQVYTSNGTVAQKFRIRGVSVIDSGSTFIIKNLGSDDKVLDVTSASRDNGAVVQLYASNGTGAQKFRVISSGGNTYYLQNIISQKYLDLDTNTETIIQQWEGQSGSNKQWELVFDKNTGSFTVMSVYTGAYLDGTAGTLSMMPKNSSDAQVFVLLPITFKVYLDAGHIVGKYGYDSGATGNGYTEAELTSDLTSRIYRICAEEYGLDIVDGKSFGISYEKRTAKAVELGCTALVSIHFNASGGSGYMTIVGSPDRRNDNSYELASLMHTYLGQAMSGLNSYGISTRGDLAIPNDSRIAATLLEIAFIDNSYDMSVYNSRRDAVARSLAQGIYEASMRGSFN